LSRVGRECGHSRSLELVEKCSVPFMIDSYLCLLFQVHELYEQRLCIIEVLGRTNRLFSFDKTRLEKDASKNSYVVTSLFLAAVTLLASRCLATEGGYTYRHRLMVGFYEMRWWDGLTCHYIHTKCHNNCFRRSKINWGGGFVERQISWWSHKPTFIFFFQNKENRLIAQRDLTNSLLSHVWLAGDPWSESQQTTNIPTQRTIANCDHSHAKHIRCIGEASRHS
jgi:hypothetical protein